MPEKVQVYGGPADGLKVAPADRFVRLEVVVLKRPLDSDGIGLYELRNGAYVYIGGRKAVCGCGAVVSKPADDDSHQPCGICGEAVA